MIETKDFVSFLIGLVITLLGAFPILNKLNIGPSWFSLGFMPVQIFAFIVAIAGFYLMINSVIEITNSNAIGWISFLIAGLFLALGILQVLNRFNIGPNWFAMSWISPLVYWIIFVIEGLFLMIAMFAMEI